ncbi:MAG: ATP synthase F1 subunit epsilon [Alphaproteobacteria bacterium]|nr:ATP synthase F1 subunit epsilon [Alphaproteobacteria bacterium]
MEGGLLKVKICTPKKIVVNEDCEKLVVPAEKGPMAVLDRRAPAIAALTMGMVSVVLQGGQPQDFFIDNGFARVNNNVCLIAVDEAISSRDINKMDVANSLNALKSAYNQEKTAEIKEDLMRRIAFAEYIIAELDKGRL